MIKKLLIKILILAWALIVPVSSQAAGISLMLGGGSSDCTISPLGISADLYAPFDCPTSDTTLTNGQVLDTEAEGVQKDSTISLTVVDTGTGTVKIVSGELELVGDGVSYTATGFYSTTAITKELGKAILLTTNAAGVLSSRYGLNSTPAIVANPDIAYVIPQDTVIYFDTEGISQINVGSITTPTEYQQMFLMGGYDSNGIAFKTGDTPSNFLYGSRFLIKGGTYTNWTLLYASSKGNTGTVYPCFNLYTATAETFDNLLIPTAVLDVDTMFQPQWLDVFTGIPAQHLTAPGYNPYVVSGTSPTGTGSPYNSGASTWHIAGVGSGASNIPTALNELYLTSETGLTQGIFDIDITFTHTSGVTAGRIFCLDSVSNPQNYVEAYYNSGTSKVELQKFVAGSPTSLINTAATYVAGATLRGIVDYIVATDDLKIKIYYNGALISIEQTITEDAIAGNTIHGLLAASPNDLLENSVIHNRTDSNWDTEITTATGGAY